MAHLTEGLVPPIYEINAAPGRTELDNPVPAELAELTRQVDDVYGEALFRGLGSTGLDLGELVAKSTNTGGHQGGNSEFGNPQKERYGGDKSNNGGGNNGGSGGKGGN